MKPKRVFVLALRNTIVTALDHLQWKVITPTLSSLGKKQACIELHSAVSFGELHAVYVYSGRLILWDFHERTLHSFPSLQLYTQVEPTNHIEKEMDVQLRRGTCQATWRVVLDVCTAHYKKEALYGRDISTNHVA